MNIDTQPLPTLRTCACGCGKIFPPRAGRGGKSQIYFDETCRQRVYDRKLPPEEKRRRYAEKMAAVRANRPPKYCTCGCGQVLTGNRQIFATDDCERKVRRMREREERRRKCGPANICLRCGVEIPSRQKYCAKHADPSRKPIAIDEQGRKREMRVCVCGCGREFIATSKHNRTYFDNACRARMSVAAKMAKREAEKLNPRMTLDERMDEIVRQAWERADMYERARIEALNPGMKFTQNYFTFKQVEVTA